MAGINQLSDLLPELARCTPLCPDNERLAMLRLGWRQFCLESRAWRVIVQLTETDDQQIYELATDYTAQIIEVLDLRALSTTNTNDWVVGAPLHRSLWRYNEIPRDPKLTIRWNPDTTGTRYLMARCVIVPAPEFTEAEDNNFFTTFNRAPLAWAARDLCNRAGRPWTDPQEAERRRVEYNNIISDARAIAERQEYQINGMAATGGFSA